MEAFDLLISLRPAYADLVTSGVKTVELRRTFPRVIGPNTRLLIWKSGADGALIGWAPIVAAPHLPVALIARDFVERAASGPEALAEYFQDRLEGYAVILGAFRPFAAPLSLSGLRALGLQPPQSFRYVARPLWRALESAAGGQVEHRVRGVPASVPMPFWLLRGN